MARIKPAFAIILTSLFVTISLLALGQAGGLDNTFDADGKVTFGFGTDAAYCYSVASQTDGKIIVAGYSRDNYVESFAIARLNSDGSFDASFDTDGKVITSIGTNGDRIRSIAIQSDGKVIAAGSTHDGTEYDFALVRYNTDGTLDNTFSGDGKVTTDFNSQNDICYGVTIQTDGKIVAVGETNYVYDYYGYYNIVLTRYNADGSLDSSFDSDGKVVTAFVNDEVAYSVALQPDGKIVVAGPAWNGLSYDFILVRYNTDGSLDNSFGNNGEAIGYIPGWAGIASSVALQSDGKIVLAGFISNDVDWKYAVMRFKTDGTLDTTFAGIGYVGIEIGATKDWGQSVLIQPDSKIVIVGYSMAGPTMDFSMVRLDTNGSPDQTFSGDGKVSTAMTSSSDDYAYSVALQPDGAVVAGTSLDSYADFAVARYISGLALGVLEFTKTNPVLVIYPNPLQDVTTLEYELNNDETISIALYDMKGNEVQLFFSGEKRLAGKHKEVLHISSKLSKGNYLLKIQDTEGDFMVKVMK